MQKTKRSLQTSLFVAATVGVLGIGLGATPAVADDQPAVPTPPITLTEEQRSNILDEFDKFDVNLSQGEQLLDKLEDGAGWDSLSNAEPISVAAETIEGFNYTISRFADGSFVAVGIEESKPVDPNARAIQSCSSSGTSAGVSYRTNCTIIATTGVASGQFKASFSYWATGTSIYDVGNGVINSDIGAATPSGFSSSSAGTKWTQFNWTSVIDGWSQASRYVRLTVSTSGASSSANF